MKAIEIYAGSDGDATKRFYAQLEALGAVGVVAVNLFRAQKCSSRAKVYRGGIRGQGSYKSMAYERKAWAIENLVKTLAAQAAALGIRYGWKKDPNEGFASWVLYVDLPDGQVSFHSTQRFDGPDYSSDWDGQHRSAERIIAFCDAVLAQHPQQELSL